MSNREEYATMNNNPLSRAQLLEEPEKPLAIYKLRSATNLHTLNDHNMLVDETNQPFCLVKVSSLKEMTGEVKYCYGS